MTDTLVVIVGVSIVTWLLLRAVRPTARLEGDTSVLDYGRTFKIFAVCAWLLVAVLVAAAISQPTERNLAYVLVPVFALMALYLQLEFFRVRIVVDEFGIRPFSPWRRPRAIPWQAVKGVTHSSLAQWHVIETDGFGRVRLPLYLSGVKVLLGELERRGFELPKRSA